MIYFLDDGDCLVDIGPMTMTIRAEVNGRTSPHLAKLGAEKALETLKTVGGFKKFMSQTVTRTEDDTALPSIVSRMIMATRAMKCETLTPMAAVAGSIAEEVAEFLFQHKETTRVIVNNGGDIAVRVRDGAEANVACKLDLEKPGADYILKVRCGDGCGGVATSGLGGRSFTKGIASAVVVAAKDGAFADAAATVLGNATNVDDANVQRGLARDLDPDTDIPDHLITLKVGHLSQAAIDEALRNGLTEANRLQREGVILGALLAVKGNVVLTDGLKDKLRELSEALP